MCLALCAVTSHIVAEGGLQVKWKCVIRILIYKTKETKTTTMIILKNKIQFSNMHPLLIIGFYKGEGINSAHLHIWSKSVKSSFTDLQISSYLEVMLNCC